MSSNKKAVTHIYGCGGLGVNAVYRFVNSPEGKVLDVIGADVSYLDTSHKNLIGKNIPNDKIYVPEGLRGGGKKRSENIEEIKDHYQDILIKHPEGLFNIFVFSTGGASGSTIGPVLISELLNREIPTIAIVVGDTSSLTEAKNTIDTIDTLRRIVRVRNAPVIMCYCENDTSHSQAEIDASIASFLAALCLLLNDVNGVMDFEDLRNFLHFSRVVDVPPSLCTLNYFTAEEVALLADKEVEPIALASLYRDMGKRRPLDLGHLYNCDGQFSNEFGDTTNLDQVHYVINSANHTADLHARLQGIYDEHSRKAAARSKKASSSSFDGDKKADDMGIIV